MKDTMKVTRIFQNQPLQIGEIFNLDDEGYKHIKATRKKVGDELIIFNGNGHDHCSKILEIKKNCQLEVMSVNENHYLAQCIGKGVKMDLIIQKAVELGVKKITPIISERVVVKINEKNHVKKIDHWKKIIISACEQSNRSVIPELSPIETLDNFFQQHDGNGIILDPESKTRLGDIDELNNVTLLIGPEGGFSDREIRLSYQANFMGVSLGKRILRMETASIASLSNCQLLWGS
ncbi:MAG: 16S rRNA (uracil(1498)-N(3))-methyltransferase [Gammaproteobacteria bacterium]|nr:16S rRNA (uracil(1498)-N(3))-methyltransferase [Gammaproteobacteria bacterium]